MKKHDYYFGDVKCYSYHKPVGHGYEVGFYFGKHNVFVGNFIHAREAAKWWGLMNREMKTFTKRYKVGTEASLTWYTKFFAAHLYKTYYKYLDTQFTKYQRTFEKVCKTDDRKYHTMKKKWHVHSDYHRFVKAA